MKKLLVIVVIILLLSVIVIPSAGSIVDKKSIVPTSNGNTLYVGGDEPIFTNKAKPQKKL